MRRGLRIFLLAAAALGCSRLPPQDSRRFPIGMFDVDDPRCLPELAQAGFDSIQSYSQDPGVLEKLAQEARRRDLRLVIDPKSLLDAPLDGRRWPLDAWYLYDEVDVQGRTPEEIETYSRKVRLWDPRGRQTFVVGEGAPARKYGGLGDVLMLDWYPVPHLALDSVADQIDLAAEALPEGKPLWMILQAFDWRDSVQRDPTKPRVGRFPYFSEIRFMSYLAIVHGARGLFYFSFKKPGGKTLFDWPQYWHAVASVTREIAALKPILEGGQPARLPFPVDTDGIEARAWLYQGRRYVVILNRGKDAMRRVPAALLGGGWRPLFEPRRDVRELLTKAGDEWYLPPFRVMVFEGS